MKALSGMVILSGLLVTQEARADEYNEGVVAYDYTYGWRAMRYWHWVAGRPEFANPVRDPTGEYADDGQKPGPLWLLAGSSGETVTRTVTIPSGKYVFFPVFSAAVSLESVKTDMTTEAVATELAGIEVQTFLDSIVDYWCEVDGVEMSHLDSYLVGPTKITLRGVREHNILGLPRVGPYQVVQGGIYLMLEPLAAGEHTIHMFASDDAGYTSDVTYNLTVE